MSLGPGVDRQHMPTHQRIDWTPVQLPSGVNLRLSRHEYRGTANGPTVYIQAAQHGREVNGTEAIRRLHDYLIDAAEFHGTVVTVPVADPLTFDRRSYTTPEELDSIAPNMNRVWPGDEAGSIHERLAAALWTVARDATVIIDLHTASASTLPHVVFTEGDDEAEQLARAFGTELHLAEPAGEAAGPEWHAREFHGKLRVAAHGNGIPCITPELGDSERLQEGAVELGVTGIRSVLRAVGVLPGKPTKESPPRCRNHLARTRAAAAGLFRPDPSCELGTTVSSGASLGIVYNPTTFEPRQTATAEQDGVLYAVTRRGTVAAGDRLASVAIPTDQFE